MLCSEKLEKENIYRATSRW